MKLARVPTPELTLGVIVIVSSVFALLVWLEKTEVAVPFSAAVVAVAGLANFRNRRPRRPDPRT